MRINLSMGKKDQDDESEEYFSASEAESSESNKLESTRDKEHEKFHDIMSMNEIQITNMLVQAVVSKGEVVDSQLHDKFNIRRERVEMSDKQRLFCKMMLKQFFAELGDTMAMSIEDQNAMLALQ